MLWLQIVHIQSNVPLIHDSNNGLLLHGGRTDVISVSDMKTVSTYRSVSVIFGFNLLAKDFFFFKF